MSNVEATRQQLIQSLKGSPANVEAMFQQLDQSGNSYVTVSITASYDSSDGDLGMLFSVDPTDASDAYVLGTLSGFTVGGGNDTVGANLAVAGPGLVPGVGFGGVTVVPLCSGDGSTAMASVGGWVYVNSQSQAYAFSFQQQVTTS